MKKKYLIITAFSLFGFATQIQSMQITIRNQTSHTLLTNPACTNDLGQTYKNTGHIVIQPNKNVRISRGSESDCFKSMKLNIKYSTYNPTSNQWEPDVNSIPATAQVNPTSNQCLYSWIANIIDDPSHPGNPIIQVQ